MYRLTGGRTEVFLVHPGGPYFARKDQGVWTIPKGSINPGEEELDAARREFLEETGWPSCGPFVPLGEVTQRSGKQVVCWAFEAPDGIDPDSLRSNLFSMVWPPGSGRRSEFPEVDRGEFFGLPEARAKMIEAQWPFLDRLVQALP